MPKDILALISERMSGFSKGQKRIASYIVSDYDKAAFMTARKLGKTVNVSESTVVRFAAELGYDGYPSMQKALQEMIRNKLTSVQRIEVSDNRIGDSSVLDAVLHTDIEKIRSTLEEVDRESFARTVDLIDNARRIYILGVRSSAAIASFLSFYFNLIFDNVTLVQTTSASEMFERLLYVGPGDLLIGVSFPRYSQRTIQAMEFARAQGADVVALTDSETAPPAQVAVECLLAKSDMISFVDSLVAPLSLANALIVAVGRKRKDKISTNFELLERIWDEYEVYKKIDEQK